MGFDPQALPVALNRPDLRLVLLRCPYDTIHDPRTQRLYGKLLDLKVTSYLAEYPYGANPIDGADIFATHLLLCSGPEEDLQPIMGMKSVTLNRCLIHNYPFPAFGLTKDPSDPQRRLPDHDSALLALVEAARARGESIAYNGSWAIHPDVRGDKIMQKICREISVLYLIQYYRDYGIPQVIAGATLRFKVEGYKEFVGYEYLSHAGNRLPSIECKPFFGEQVAIMHLRQFRPEALQWANRYRALWEKRLVIGDVGAERVGRPQAA